MVWIHIFLSFFLLVLYFLILVQCTCTVSITDFLNYVCFIIISKSIYCHDKILSCPAVSYMQFLKLLYARFKNGLYEWMNECMHEWMYIAFTMCQEQFLSLWEYINSPTSKGFFYYRLQNKTVRIIIFNIMNILSYIILL